MIWRADSGVTPLRKDVEGQVPGFQQLSLMLQDRQRQGELRRRGPMPAMSCGPLIFVSIKIWRMWSVLMIWPWFGSPFLKPKQLRSGSLITAFCANARNRCESDGSDDCEFEPRSTAARTRPLAGEIVDQRWVCVQLTQKLEWVCYQKLAAKFEPSSKGEMIGATVHAAWYLGRPCNVRCRWSTTFLRAKLWLAARSRMNPTRRQRRRHLERISRITGQKLTERYL